MNTQATDHADWSCPSCQRVNLWKEFCPACSTRTGIYCPNCGALTALRLRFCHACGQEKEKVYQQQKDQAVAQARARVENVRRSAWEAQQNLALPAMLFKGVFARGYFCGRSIGGFLIFSGLMLFVMLVSMAPTMRPQVVETARGQARFILALGVALMVIPPIYGYAAETRRQMEQARRMLPDLETAVANIEQIGFVEWCAQRRVSALQEQRSAEEKRQRDHEMEKYDKEIRADRELEETRERFRQWDREFDEREQEKRRAEED